MQTFHKKRTEIQNFSPHKPLKEVKTDYMDKIKSILQEKVIQILSKGRVPNHIAFIMDGNRRWASSQNKPKIEGHRAGAMNLKRVIEMLSDVGVKEMTVYALSVKNL